MEKLGIMAQGLADKNIITMLLIFLTAGVFVGVVGRSSAESVAYFMLSIIPTRFSVAVLFGVACFVSLAMGTSEVMSQPLPEVRSRNFPGIYLSSHIPARCRQQLLYLI